MPKPCATRNKTNDNEQPTQPTKLSHEFAVCGVANRQILNTYIQYVIHNGCRAIRCPAQGEGALIKTRSRRDTCKQVVVLMHAC